MKLVKFATGRNYEIGTGGQVKVLNRINNDTLTVRFNSESLTVRVKIDQGCREQSEFFKIKDYFIFANCPA